MIRLTLTGLQILKQANHLSITLHHADGNSEIIQVNHTYNEQQIEWFKAGGALNIIRRQFVN